MRMRFLQPSPLFAAGKWKKGPPKLSALTATTAVAAIGMGIVAPTAARAATVSYSATIPQTSVSFTTPFTLPLFDSSLGTLLGAQISLVANTVATVTVFNTASTPQSFTAATASVPLTITGPDGTFVTATAVTGPVSATVNPGSTSFPGQTGSATSTVNVSLANLSSYIGTGGATANFSALGSTGTYSGNTASSQLFFGGSATAGGTVSITYTYQALSAAPEPGAFALLVSVLPLVGGITTVRRRKRRALTV